VYKWVDEYGGRICDQLRRMGSSVDWSRQVFTMDETRAVRGAEGVEGDRAKGSQGIGFACGLDCAGVAWMWACERACVRACTAAKRP
jgi:hypothetical protein